MKRIVCVFFAVALMLLSMTAALAEGVESTDTVEATTEEVKTEEVTTEEITTEEITTEEVTTEEITTEEVTTEEVTTEEVTTEEVTTEEITTEEITTEEVTTEEITTEEVTTEEVTTEEITTEEVTTEGITTEEVTTEEITTEEITTEEDTHTLDELLDLATPEQIQAIKDYIMLGLELVNGEDISEWDKLKSFVISNLDAIAWIFAGIAFIVFFIGNRILKKNVSKEAAVMNNNAVELAEKTDKHISETVDTVKLILEDAEDFRARAVEELEKIKNTETAYTESVALMAAVVNELLQLSKLPQWRRDEITVKFNAAMAQLDEARTAKSQTSESEEIKDENGEG